MKVLGCVIWRGKPHLKITLLWAEVLQWIKRKKQAEIPAFIALFFMFLILQSAYWLPWCHLFFQSVRETEHKKSNQQQNKQITKISFFLSCFITYLVTAMRKVINCLIVENKHLEMDLTAKLKFVEFTTGKLNIK